MKTSIATVSLGGTLAEKLELTAAAGFDGVEIFETDILTHDGPPASVGRLVRDLGLEIVSLQPFRDFECMPEPQRARGFDRARRKFNVMAELGTSRMLVCSNTSALAQGGIDRAAADLAELGEIAAGYGITVGYEALAWGRHVWDYRDAWEIVRRADHPNIALILDSWHLLARGLPVDPIRSIAADKIAFVQVADAPALDMDLLQWSRHFRNFPGQGDLDVPGFMRALGATGYDGWLSLEIFNDRFRMANPRTIAQDGRRSLIWLLDETAPGADPLPPPVRCEAMEFIEFAVDEALAEELRGLLRSLGFRRAGTHRSKDVERWAQGEINLVVNSEREGFAHAHYVVHGPSVCALCLRVDDAAGAMQRAERLLVQGFRQAVGPGELQVPAVRGLGGSLIHFTDSRSALSRIWDTDFQPVADGPDSDVDAGLTRIDHIAQSMPHEEVLSWRLFYLALFDFEKTPQVDIVDPAGIVESQVVQSADRLVRICLNASQSGRTMAARFMAEFYGAGVQHIAFATADVAATVAALRRNGVAPLPIPPNYYDDAQARFGLDDEAVERLRAGDLLYDEDETGAYLQLYTPVFADRFFFEIVERRDRYAGFGAANAPIRLAAQSRQVAELGPV